MIKARIFIQTFSFLIAILALQLISVKLEAQIVNIERQRMVTDTTGWSGNIGLSIAASKAAKSYFTFNGNGHLQFKTKRDLWLGIVDYDLVNAGGEEFGNSGFGHIRYNRKLSELVRIEAFTQVQFNEIQKIDLRYLNGTGIRLKLSQFERAKFYFGLTYMYEYEEIFAEEEINKDHRLSSYFTFTLIPETEISLSTTTYIQPRFEDFRDFRLSVDTRLTFKITSKLQFLTIFHFLHDSRPPEDIPTSSYRVYNGLSYSF